jgi:hypothetical protein
LDDLKVLAPLDFRYITALILLVCFEILRFFVGDTFFGLLVLFDALMDSVEEGSILIGTIGIVSVSPLPVELLL